MSLFYVTEKQIISQTQFFPYLCHEEILLVSCVLLIIQRGTCNYLLLSTTYGETVLQQVDPLFGIIQLSSCVIGLMAALMFTEKLFTVYGQQQQLLAKISWHFMVCPRMICNIKISITHSSVIYNFPLLRKRIMNNALHQISLYFQSCSQVPTGLL